MGSEVKQVTTKCATQVFDNSIGRIYYPDEEATISLDSEVALSFLLTPEDRKIAREFSDARSKARKKELDEMKKEGFMNYYQYRQFLKQKAEEKMVEATA